jgi:hypothetical protein
MIETDSARCLFWGGTCGLAIGARFKPDGGGGGGFLILILLLEILSCIFGGGPLGGGGLPAGGRGRGGPGGGGPAGGGGRTIAVAVTVAMSAFEWWRLVFAVSDEMVMLTFVIAYSACLTLLLPKKILTASRPGYSRVAHQVQKKKINQ